MELIPTIVPKLERVQFSLEILAVPGRPFPSLHEIKNILDQSLEPHLGINVSGGKYLYAERKDCTN